MPKAVKSKKNSKKRTKRWHVPQEAIRVTIGKIKVSLTLSKDDAEHLRSTANLAGLSLAALIASKVTEDASILASSEGASAWWQIQEPRAREQLGPLWEVLRRKEDVDRIFGFKSSYGSPLPLEMRFTAVPIQFDPIVNTIDLICESFELRGRSSLLRLLYEQLLKKNKLTTSGGTLKSNHLKQIRNIEWWLPYHWPNRPWDFSLGAPTGNIQDFSILLEGNHGNKSDFTIQLRMKEKESDALWETLPLLTKKLWRSPSNLFQLLYLSYLRTHDIVDDRGYLVKDFANRIETMGSLFAAI